MVHVHNSATQRVEVEGTVPSGEGARGAGQEEYQGLLLMHSVAMENNIALLMRLYEEGIVIPFVFL